MPGGNIATLETDEYYYVLSLSPVTMNGALSLCPMYGDGFFLANIDDEDELKFIQTALEDLNLLG